MFSLYLWKLGKEGEKPPWERDFPLVILGWERQVHFAQISLSSCVTILDFLGLWSNMWCSYPQLKTVILLLGLTFTCMKRGEHDSICAFVCCLQSTITVVDITWMWVVTYEKVRSSKWWKAWIKEFQCPLEALSNWPREVRAKKEENIPERHLFLLINIPLFQGVTMMTKPFAFCQTVCLHGSAWGKTVLTQPWGN